jgi:hypothetical protein
MSRRNAIMDKTCNRLELVDDPMPSRATWVFQPRYRYRLMNEKVCYHDEILIYNHKYSVMIHFTKENDHIEIGEGQEIVEQKHSEFWMRSLFRRRNPGELFTCYEANCS